MINFNPEIRLVAIDAADLVLTFDSASAEDEARSLKVIRLPRVFTQLRVEVSTFTRGNEVADYSTYQGKVNVVVVTGEDEKTLTLAELNLRVPAKGRSRKKGAPPFEYHLANVVHAVVRQGVCGAFSAALGAFYAKEAYLDALSRSPKLAEPVVAPGTAMTLPSSPLFASGGVGPAANFWQAPAANQSSGTAQDRRRFAKRLGLTAVASVAVVLVLLGVTGGLKPRDPVKEAVTRAMSRDPSIAQAQIDITKQTLRDMGLDPGKSADLGCLAAK